MDARDIFRVVMVGSWSDPAPASILAWVAGGLVGSWGVFSLLYLYPSTPSHHRREFLCYLVHNFKYRVGTLAPRVPMAMPPCHAPLSGQAHRARRLGPTRELGSPFWTLHRLVFTGHASGRDLLVFILVFIA